MTIEMKLSAIYKAAHVSIPDQAEKLGTQGEEISGATSGVSTEIGKLGHSLGTDVLNLGDEIVFRLSQVTKTMNECATALDRIADDFVATDSQASSWMGEHKNWLNQNGYSGEPDQTRVPTPPKDG